MPPGTFLGSEPYSSTHCGQLILRKKTSKLDATKCRILRLKCTKSDFRWRPSSKGMDGKGRGREGNGTFRHRTAPDAVWANGGDASFVCSSKDCGIIVENAPDMLTC